MESLALGRRLFRAYPWGKPQLVRGFLRTRLRRGKSSPVDKSEEKTSTEVTDGRKCNPTGLI